MRNSIRIGSVAFALALIAPALGARSEDWPAYQRDNHRSARTVEDLRAACLREAWVYEAPEAPQPAWGGPHKYDAYAYVVPLRSMRNYDPVFHTIAVGGRVYYGSSSDDAVHCLDAATGERLWSFTTGGPVRIAPAWHAGNLYFGSDDGYAYCIRADAGTLVWRFSPSPQGEHLVINDGKFISYRPCRTGVLVADGLAYFGASMLPWKESYICAVDAETGRPEGPGTFVRRLDESESLEGALLASSQRLISPQGRIPPLFFSRTDGKKLGSLGGGGGCFVLLTPDEHVMHGPGNRTGWIVDSNARDRSQIATFPGGNAMVVADDMAYVLTDTSLAAVDRKTRKDVWKTETQTPYALIMAGEALYAGGADCVVAYRASDGRPIWEAKVRGQVHGLAAANGALLASTHEGRIYCFRPGDAAQPYDAKPMPAPQAEEIKDAPGSATLAAGPYLRFISRDSAVVQWETREPSPTALNLTVGEETRRFEKTEKATDHEIELSGLRPLSVYKYTIEVGEAGATSKTREYECETFFNYSLPDISQRPTPYADDALGRATAASAERILSETGLKEGICLVLGSDEGRLATELARRSQLRVIGLDTDAGRVTAARQRLQEAGLYGSRVRIMLVDSLDSLPFSESCANLIVSDAMLAAGACVGDKDEIFRLLRPLGGTAYLGQPEGIEPKLDRAKLLDWIGRAPEGFDIETSDSLAWVRVTRSAPLPGAGRWSHEYGPASNAAFDGETLRGARTATDFEVQWVGRPGPRYQPDRNGRKPAPLAANGRLFAQGLHRLIALDAYNGTILWTTELPDIERFNMPRDCGNWCADDDYVYAAVRDRCWKIDAATGKVVRFFPLVEGGREGWDYEWSYLAREGNLIVASAAKQGASFTNFWGGGGEGWYDATAGPATDKVCSENLFALDAQSAKKAWTYTSGLVVNPTIAVTAGRVHFVECRNAKAIASEERRLGTSEFWKDQYLVALDAKSGVKLYEKPLDIAPGVTMLSIACGEGKLALVSSGDNMFHVYVFDAASGEPLWDAHFPWRSNNHGGHMGRPAIANGTLYVRPAVFDLSNGKCLDADMPGGGCGTYAVSDNAVLYRAGNVTLWSPASAQVTSWSRLRPDCWLSAIPAQGLVLAPEAGGGCSCGNWMETSIAFMPLEYPAPTLRSAPRTFVDQVEAELLSHVPGGAIRYTLDGSEPTEGSAEYASTITLTDSATLRARTFWAEGRNGKPTQSPLLEHAFTRAYPAPSFATSAATFVDRIEVGLVSPSERCEVRYTLDGSDPTLDSPLYAGPIALHTTTTIQAAAFWSAEHAPKATASTALERRFGRIYPEPRFGPQSDVFAGATVVELINPSTEGVVRYTLDGSEPTAASPPYDAPLVLKATTTVRAATFWTDGGAGAPVRSAFVAKRFESVEPRLARACKVNFQNGAEPRPEGYEIDLGSAFGIHRSGLSYGWNRPSEGNMARRKVLDKPELDTFAILRPDAEWSIAVETGAYDVTVSLGDGAAAMENAFLWVENVEFCKGLSLEKGATTRIAKEVVVQDGELTLRGANSPEAGEARVNYIEIRKR